jgi:hypothetical protein
MGNENTGGVHRPRQAGYHARVAGRQTLRPRSIPAPGVVAPDRAGALFQPGLRADGSHSGVGGHPATDVQSNAGETAAVTDRTTNARGGGPQRRYGTGNRQTPPAVVGDRGRPRPHAVHQSEESAECRSGVTARSVGAGTRGGRLPPGGPSETPPALLHRSPTLTREGRGYYVGWADGFRLARGSSASSSRCATSSLRIKSSRAWLAVRQLGIARRPR